MTETTTSTPAAASAEVGKKGKKVGSGKKGSKSAAVMKTLSHPPTSQMVDEAIRSLHERGGSSLQAIKKYVVANFKVEPSKAIFIRKYLKNAVSSGHLVQTKGLGANGSFKFPSKDKPVKKPVAKKAATPKKASAPKTVTPKKKPAVKKPKPTKAAKSPAKPKPKPKKLKATPAKPKKAAPAKKPAKAGRKKAPPKKK